MGKNKESESNEYLGNIHTQKTRVIQPLLMVGNSAQIAANQRGQEWDEVWPQTRR